MGQSEETLENFGKCGEGSQWEEENISEAVEFGEMTPGTRMERYDWGNKTVVKVGK